MIFIDSRIGSSEIAPHPKRLGVPIRLDILESADFAWVGDGPGGQVSAGVERKTIKDLIQSRNEGRLAGSGGQVSKLCATYDDKYLLIEVNYRIGDSGLLLTWDYTRKDWQPISVHRGFREYYITYDEIFKFTLTLSRGAGMIPIWTTSQTHTARVLADMYWHYQAKWSDHKSLQALNQAHTVSEGGNGTRSRFTFDFDHSPSILRMVASQLPHIGYKKSAEVEKVFSTVYDMCMASLKDWCKIPGIGKTIARQIHAAIHEPRGGCEGGGAGKGEREP